MSISAAMAFVNLGSKAAYSAVVRLQHSNPLSDTHSLINQGVHIRCVSNGLLLHLHRLLTMATPDSA